MRELRRPTHALFCSLLLILSGCWMGGNSRSNYRPPALEPTPPAVNTPHFNTPQYGPTVPFPQGQPTPAPLLDGPVLEGPAFPQSGAGAPLSSEDFNRQRHSQQSPDKNPNYAGTAPPPIIPDGPIASQQSQTPQRAIGYLELPPAP